MGNFRDIETEFVERTLAVISQYEDLMHKFPEAYRYNHTLLVNCMLGLIVFPKENSLTYLPKDRLDNRLKEQMGIATSEINPEITELRALIIALRHSVAHFDIDFISQDDKFLIDEIVFKDRQRGDDYYVVKFKPDDLLGFVQYYAGWLLHNLKHYRQ
jgi:hypothetical protein